MQPAGGQGGTHRALHSQVLMDELEVHTDRVTELHRDVERLVSAASGTNGCCGQDNGLLSLSLTLEGEVLLHAQRC